jgi:hypothetical protein
MCIVRMLAPDVDTLAPTIYPLHAQVTPTHTRATSDDWSRSTVASIGHTYCKLNFGNWRSSVRCTSVCRGCRSEREPVVPGQQAFVLQVYVRAHGVLSPNGGKFSVSSVDEDAG